MAVGSFCMQTVTVRDLISANFPGELVNSVMPTLIQLESLQRVVEWRTQNRLILFFFFLKKKLSCSPQHTKLISELNVRSLQLFYRGGRDSFPDQSLWDLLRANWHWTDFITRYLGFLLLTHVPHSHFTHLTPKPYNCSTPTPYFTP